MLPNPFSDSPRAFLRSLPRAHATPILLVSLLLVGCSGAKPTESGSGGRKGGSAPQGGVVAEPPACLDLLEPSHLRPDTKDWAKAILGERYPERLLPVVWNQPTAVVTLLPSFQVLIGRGDRTVVTTWSEPETADLGALILLWDLSGKKPVVRDRVVLKSGIGAIVLSPDGKTLAACDTPHTVTMWDIHEGKFKERARLTWADTSIRHLMFSSDETTLVAWGGKVSPQLFLLGPKVRSWSLSGDKPTTKWTVDLPAEFGGDRALGGPFVTEWPDGKSFAVVRDEKKFCLLDRATGKLELNPVIPSNPKNPLLEGLRRLKGSYRGSFPADSDTPKLVAFWDYESKAIVLYYPVGTAWKQRARLVGHTDDPDIPVVFSHDGSRLVSAEGPDKRVLLWNQDGKLIGDWNWTNYRVDVIRFSADGRHLFLNISSVFGGTWIGILRLPK